MAGREIFSVALRAGRQHDELGRQLEPGQPAVGEGPDVLEA